MTDEIQAVIEAEARLSEAMKSSNVSLKVRRAMVDMHKAVTRLTQPVDDPDPNLVP